MSYKDKLRYTVGLLQSFPAPQAVMCSFGKDSMVLLHLIRETLPKNPLSAHQFPVPVIFHRHPYFPAKNDFANKIISSLGLEVYEPTPLAIGVKAKEDRIELVTRYPFGTSGMDLPLNTEEPMPRRDYVCGLQFLLRPKSIGMQFPVATVFHGHKDCDIDPYEGKVPLKHDAEDIGEVSVVFPLRHWSDEDVWNYLEENHVDYDKRRYAGHKEVPDTWLNPDYLHACTRCVDPRNTTDKEVLCPKTGKNVPNLGSKVLRLDQVPDYIQKEVQHAQA